VVLVVWPCFLLKQIDGLIKLLFGHSHIVICPWQTLSEAPPGPASHADSGSAKSRDTAPGQNSAQL
jgi:hypothetical protein